MAWRAGVAKVDITPPHPVYMMGYGNRTRKHEEVLLPIFCRALALEDAAGTTCVQLSVELLGVSNEMVAEVADAVSASHGVAAAAVRITATHTHSAPSLSNVYCGCCECGWITLHPQPEDTSREQGVADIAAYTEYVTALLIQAARAALDQRQPAELSHGVAQCDFAVNRRNNVESEVERMSEAGTLDKSALNGPFDHDCELLVVRRAGSVDGSAMGVCFGYSCHATVMGAQSLHGGE